MRRSPSPRVAGRTAPPWRRPQLTMVSNALIIALECATDAQMKVAMTGGVVRINRLQAEIGLDMTRFTTAGHLVSWANCARAPSSPGRCSVAGRPARGIRI